MKKKLGVFSFLMLLITLVLLGFSISSISFTILILPYIMLSASLTIGSALIFFFSLNGIGHKFLKVLMFLISFLPAVIPALFVLDLIKFQNYGNVFAFLTIVQIGFSILSASLFFRDHSFSLSNILTLSSAICCFILAGLVLREISLIGSFAFTSIFFAITSTLFLSGLVLKLKKIY